MRRLCKNASIIPITKIAYVSLNADSAHNVASAKVGNAVSATTTGEENSAVKNALGRIAVIAKENVLNAKNAPIGDNEIAITDNVNVKRNNALSRKDIPIKPMSH